MKKALFIILYISASVITNAREADSLLKANDLYAKGNFQDATVVYENILNQGFESAELYYNLGNAYYKQSVVAKAILYYEKALHLAPNDEDIKYNLELANRFVVDKIEVLPVFFITGWIRNLKNAFKSDIWAVISITAFILTLIFISLYLYSRGLGFKKLSFWISFIMIFIAVISFLFSYQQKKKILSGSSAIVVNPSVTVKSSPDASGTDLFVIHEGTKVRIEDKISDWKEIKLSDGSKGWLKSEDIETI